MIDELPELATINGKYYGEHTISFHTIGLVSDEGSNNPRQFFDNFSFIGPRYQGERRQLYNEWDAGDSNVYESWFSGWVVDPKNYALVIDALNRVERKWNQQNTKLVKCTLTYRIEEVDTKVDEYAEIKKWRAIQKLTSEEVLMLGLEKDAVYLKLKFDRVEDEDYGGFTP